MAEVIPAIMPASLGDLRDKISRVAPYVPSVQLDIMDGLYVPPKTWPYIGAHEDFPNVSLNFPFEADLMVSHVERVAAEWIRAGAKRVIVHVERNPNVKMLLMHLKEKFRNIEIGVSILNDTNLSVLEELIPHAHFVQLMGIARIGYQGEPFDERVLQKIAALRAAHPDVTISVDGAVNADTAPRLVEAGAHRLVSGSFIYESENIAEAIKTLKNA